MKYILYGQLSLILKTNLIICFILKNRMDIFHKSENAKGSTNKDLKEFFHIYPWGRCPKSLEQKTRVLHSQLVRLASQLLLWVQENVPEHIATNFSIPLYKMIEDSPQNLMRIINYPSLSEELDLDGVRAAA